MGYFFTHEELKAFQERQDKAVQEIQDLSEGKKQWQVSDTPPIGGSEEVITDALKDYTTVARAYLALKDNVLKALKVLDEHGVWTGMDDDIHDRVAAVCSNPDYFLGKRDKPS